MNRASYGGGTLEKLQAAINQHCPGTHPMVFRGASLFGPTGGVQGVLMDCSKAYCTGAFLGRGAAVLVDTNAGVHELLFFSEDHWQPLARWQISPSVRLQYSQQPGLGMLLGFCVNGEVGCSIAFDAEADAVAFQRDFQVRQRLMAVSLKASHGLQSVEVLQQQVDKLRCRFMTGVWSACGWILWLAILLLLAVVARATMLYLADPQRIPAAAAEVALAETSSVAHATIQTAAFLTSATCQYVTQGVSAADLEQCVRLPVAEVRACARALLSA